MPPVILHRTFRQAPFLPLRVEREEHANARHTYSCHTYSLRFYTGEWGGGVNIHGLLLQNGVNEPIDSTHPEKPLFVECFPWYQKPLLLR